MNNQRCIPFILAVLPLRQEVAEIGLVQSVEKQAIKAKNQASTL
jgi:hypothetical protein